MNEKEMGSFIAQRRKELGLTQAQLAERLHVTDKAVSKWERGAGLPDIGNLSALAEALSVSVAELLQARRLEEPSMKAEDVDSLLSSTLDIADRKRKETAKRLIAGLLLCALGLVLVCSGLSYLMIPKMIPHSIGGADGPTQIFITGRLIPDWLNFATVIGAVCFAVGAVCFAVGLWRLLRRRP